MCGYAREGVYVIYRGDEILSNVIPEGCCLLYRFRFSGMSVCVCVCASVIKEKLCEVYYLRMKHDCGK